MWPSSGDDFGWMELADTPKGHRGIRTKREAMLYDHVVKLFDLPMPYPMTEIESGTIRGCYNEDKSVSIFKGIPYATSPTGKLRFTARSRQNTGTESCPARNGDTVPSRMNSGLFFAGRRNL